MTDQTSSGDIGGTVCPWCSAPLPDPGVATCPSCNAALVGKIDESLPGLTTIDAGAIVRSKQTAIRPRSRLLSWLSGEDPDDVFTKAEGNALEPPDLAVKREMFRIELEAEVANLTAENEAIMAEAAVEGRVVDVPPELADAAGIKIPAIAADADEVADAPDAAVDAADGAVTEAEPEAATGDADATPDDPEPPKGSRKRS
jgi:hypothetical protein